MKRVLSLSPLFRSPRGVKCLSQSCTSAPENFWLQAELKRVFIYISIILYIHLFLKPSCCLRNGYYCHLLVTGGVNVLLLSLYQDWDWVGGHSSCWCLEQCLTRSGHSEFVKWVNGRSQENLLQWKFSSNSLTPQRTKSRNNMRATSTQGMDTVSDGLFH